VQRQDPARYLRTGDPSQDESNHRAPAGSEVPATAQVLRLINSRRLTRISSYEAGALMPRGAAGQTAPTSSRRRRRS